MDKWTELIFGLALLVGAIVVAFYSQSWGIWNFWNAAWVVFKGSLFWVVAGLGLVFILLGITDLKDKN